MKIRLNSRLILTNILIAVLLTTVIGFIVVQGLVTFSVNETVKTLSSTANEAGVMMRQSIKTTRSDYNAHELFHQNAAFYANEIGGVYALKIVLFDSEMSVAGTNITDEDYTVFKEYALQTKDSPKQYYVYTEIDGVSNILFYSPLLIDNDRIATCLFIYPVTTTELLVSNIIKLFFGAGVVAAILASVLYYFAYKNMTSPIRKLISYTSQLKEGKIDFKEDVPYKENDEMGKLVHSFEEMAGAIEEKISELNIEKDKLDTIISSMQDGILAVKADGKVIMASERLKDFFGAETDYKSLIADFSGLIENTLSSSEGVAVEFERDEKNFLLNANKVEAYDDDPYVLMVISDVSSIKKIEEEQNRFISSVSHELKTPLTTIIGYIDMLKRRGTKDAKLTQKALDTAEAEANRLLRLVNDLLNINKLHNYDFELIFTNIDLNALIDDVTSQMDMTGMESNIGVLYEPHELPEIKGDRDRLKQTLINVIDNAIKYSSPDDVIKVSAITVGDYVEVTVRDYGEGIPPDKQEKVFESFYRVEDDRSRISKKGGYGLGLAIVKNIVTRHNGDVSIESVPGQGTLVIIRLPYIKPAEENIAQEENVDEEI